MESKSYNKLNEIILRLYNAKRDAMSELKREQREYGISTGSYDSRIVQRGLDLEREYDRKVKLLTEEHKRFENVLEGRY